MRFVNFLKKQKYTLAVIGVTGISIGGLAGFLTNSSDANANREVLVYMTQNEQSSGFKAFKLIADRYNAMIDANPQKAAAQGYKKVRPVGLSNGYGYISNFVTTNIISNNEKQVPNLVFGYGSTVAGLARYKRELNFAEKTVNESETVTYTDKNGNTVTEKKEDDHLKTDDLISSFLTISQNYFWNKDTDAFTNGIYFVPSVSSEALYLDRDLFHYLVGEAIKAKKVTIKSGDEMWFENNFALKKADQQAALARSRMGRMATDSKSGDGSTKKWMPNEGDQKYIKTIWGSFDSNRFGNNLEISKETFIYFDDLFEFTSRLGVAFPNSNINTAYTANGSNQASSSVNNTDISKGKTIGITSLANYLYTRSFIELGGDYDNFLFNSKGLDRNALRLNYPLFVDGSEQNLAFKKAYEGVKNLTEKGIFWQSAPNSTTGYRYISDIMKNHQLLAGLGSTSGIRHYVQTTNDQTDQTTKDKTINNIDDYLILPAPTRGNKSQKDKKGAYVLQGGSMFGVKSTDPEMDRATKLFVKWSATEVQNFDWKVGQETKNINLAPIDYYSITSSYIPSTKYGDQKNQPSTQSDLTSKDHFKNKTGAKWDSNTIHNIPDLLSPSARVVYDFLFHHDNRHMGADRGSSQQTQAASKLTSSSFQQDITKLVAFVDPVDSYATALRGKVESTLGGLGYEDLSNQSWPSFDVFMEIVKRDEALKPVFDNPNQISN